MIKLGFNIDHIATLRNARGEGYPNLIKAANIAIKAGAHQITAHLREDRRHIKDADIFLLKNELSVDLNMEMAVTDEMIEIACKVKPYSVCLVPEKREELTTEGGLDILKIIDNLTAKIEKLRKNNIKVVLFLDAEEKQIEKALSLPINGIEFNTGRYANICALASISGNQDGSSDLINELKRIQLMATLIVNNNIEAHAGHGLNFTNITKIAKIKEINEFNIGHFLIAEAIFIGLDSSIIKMLQLINNAR